MPTVSFEASQAEWALMQANPEIDWSEVFCRAIRERARAEQITRALMDEDADPRVQAVAKAAKAGAAERSRAASDPAQH